jgi:transposase
MKKTCGLDVHKDTIFCAVFNGEKYGQVQEYLTTTVSIYSMGEALQEEGVEEVAIESTGIYWIPVWNILEEMGFKMLLVNPYLIKQMPGRKSDVKDAQWIAALLHKGLLRGSLIPVKQIRELRVYSRKYVKLQQRQTSVLQEMERTLEVCGIRITSFVSNISGKSIMKVISQIIQGETDPDVFVKLVHGRIINKHSKVKIKEALTGFVTPQHRFLLELSLEEYELLVRQSDKCLSMMKGICQKHYQKELELLQTIPGVGLIAAMILLAETGADMKAFENSGKFTGWTGLRPRNDESAGKYKSTATTKGNRYLRSVLVQSAWAASRTKGSRFKEKFNQLAVRKPRKKALIAIARKIAVIVWNVLYYQQNYNPEKMIIYQPAKLLAKRNYHQKEFERLEKMLQS